MNSRSLIPAAYLLGALKQYIKWWDAQKEVVGPFQAISAAWEERSAWRA